MKLSQATFLILALFGSFGVVLAAMIFFLRPENNPVTTRPKPDSIPRKVAEPQEPVPDTPRSDSTASKGEDSQPAENRKKILTPAAPRPAVSAEGRRFQAKLQQEKKEMTALRKEMERRLKDQVAAREKKIAMLARNCAKLEPGEAAGILLKLDDGTVADVLHHMDKNAALKIAAILERLGRKGALLIK